VAERDWKDDLIDAANAAGLRAARDEADSILMAEARMIAVPGGEADRMAEALAADLEAKAPEPITRATCAVLMRAACNAQGLTLMGWDVREILSVVAVAAAKLEMRAKP
jgi:hypothetical protein